MFENFSKSSNNFLLNQNLFSSSFGDFCEKHNFIIIEEFSKFLNSENKYFLYEGAMGSGKSQLLKTLVARTPKNVIVLTLDCSYICSVDDFLLSLNKQLHQYLESAGNSRIGTTSNDFREKIHAFMKSIKRPIAIFIDSFDQIKYLQNKIEIFQLIEYLTDMDNTKVCFALRKIDEQLFDVGNIQKVAIPDFSKEEVQEYLKTNNKKLPQETFEKFYNLTQGACLYFTLFAKMSAIFNISIESLMNEYFKKGHDIEEFLITKFLSLVPHNYMELLWTICLAQSFVNDKMLLRLDLIQRDELRYLEKINVLYRNESCYYLKDYVKRFIEPQIDYYNKTKINRFLSEYYTSQLALKPSKRDLTISRETLRMLIKYHGGSTGEKTSETVSQTKLSNIQLSQQLNSQAQTEELFPEVEIEHTTPDAPKNVSPDTHLRSSSQPVSNEPSIINIKYTINQTPPPAKEEKKAEEKAKPEIRKEEEKPKTADYEKAAEACENSFKYEEANEYYAKALESALDDERYSIVTKMADNFYKLHDWKNAIAYYKDAAGYEKSKNNFEKYASILYIIATIYKELYKSKIAKKYYLEIKSLSEKISPTLAAKANLQLSELVNEFSSAELKEFYEAAFQCTKKADAQTLTAEIFFRYALWLDDEGSSDEAIKNYLSCTMACEDFRKNKFLSSAFANVASIYQEQGDYDNAIKYYGKALAIDNEDNNNEGKYYTYTNLAQIYQRTDTSKVVDMYKKALFAAQILEDNFYICSVLVNIGDFYYQQNKNEFALRYYLLSKKYAKGLKSFDNSNIIKNRITDIKVKMGAERFHNCLQSMKKGAK